MSVGVAVCRFQVEDLTAGHKNLVQTMRDNHSQVVIFLGCSQVGFTKNNPLPYHARALMVKEEFPDVEVHPLMDQPSDELWTKHIDITLSSMFPAQTVTLYAGRQGFLPHYKGKRTSVEIARVLGPSGTESRAETATGLIETMQQRQGAIIAVQNAYTRVNPTVDVAILRKAAFGGYEVLMARKLVEEEPTGWRFIGGFVDPTDETLERTVAREALEETGCEVGNIRYVGSMKIDDWRYRGSPEGVMTTFYAADSLFGLAKASDDVCELQWNPVKGLKAVTLSLHKPLAVMLEEFLGEKA